MLPRKKKLHNVGKNNPKQVSAERKRTRMDSSRAGKDPEVTERAESISCVGTCNTIWQQCRQQQSVLIRMKKET